MNPLGQIKRVLDVFRFNEGIDVGALKYGDSLGRESGSIGRDGSIPERTYDEDNPDNTDDKLPESPLGLIVRGLRRSSALTVISVIAGCSVVAVWLGCWGISGLKVRWWAVLLSLSLMLALMAMGYPAALAFADQ